MSRPRLRFLNPLPVRAIAAVAAALGQLGGNDGLKDGASEADEVVAAQGVLKLPVAALAVLAGEGLGVAGLAGGDAQVTAHGHEVEADLGEVVAGDAALEDVDDTGGEVGVGAGAVRDRRRL